MTTLNQLRTRRSFLKLSAGVAALGAAGGLAAPAIGQQKIELGILTGTGFSPSAPIPEVAAAYQAAWDKFQTENPDVTLKMEPHAGDTEALQDILTRGSAGRLPDVGIMDTYWIPRLHAAGYLQGMDDILSDADKTDYLPGVIEATRHDGKLRSIYIYNSWRGLFYRPSALKALGYDAPPTDWDKFLEFGAAAKAAGVQNAVMLPANTSELPMLYLFPQLLGLGGAIHDDKGKPNFFEAPNRQMLEQVYSMWRELVAKGLMPAEVGAMDEAAERPFFYSGETLTLGSSSSFIKQMYLDVPHLKGDLGAVPVPLGGGATPVPLLAAWGYTVFATDPARQDAAKRFIRFMLQPEQLSVLNAVQGQLPVRRSIWENTPTFRDDPLFQQLYAIQNDPRLRERSVFPIYPAIKDAIAGQLAGVVSGSITPSQAIDVARDQVMAAYARMAS